MSQAPLLPNDRLFEVNGRANELFGQELLSVAFVSNSETVLGAVMLSLGLS